MSEQALLDQMKKEEELYTKEISTALSAALNSPDTKKRADEINQSSGGWPYEPTKEMLKLYSDVMEKAWKKIQGGYSHVEANLAVNAPKGAAPSVSVQVKYAGEFKGGQSISVKPGESIASIAQQVYGYDSYADAIWEANTAILGAQCKQVPAGFGLSIPKIYVPNWKTPPKVKCCAGTQLKAVKILYPTLELDVESKKTATTKIVTPAFIIEITFDVTGKLKAQKAGTIDGSFNLRTYEASMEKSMGAIGGAFQADFKDGTTNGELTISNSKIKGLNMTQKITLKKGSLKVTFGSKKVSFKQGDMVFEGNLTMSATGKIKPNPKATKEPAKKGRPLTTGQKVLIVVFIAAAVVLLGVTLIPSAGTSGPVIVTGAAAVLVTAGLTG